METEVREQDAALTADLETSVEGWSFFGAVRLSWAEAARLASTEGRPRPLGVGRSSRVQEDVVRFFQKPTLELEASEVAEVGFIDTREGPLRTITQVFFGPFGQHGALPLHVTEHAVEAAYRVGSAAEQLRGDERTLLPDFLDMFTDRMTALLYRAWETTQPAVNRELGDADQYHVWLGALYGQGEEVFWHRDKVPDDHKRYMAGWMSNPRGSTAAIEAVLSTLTGVPMYVEEFVDEWLELPPSEQSRLGIAPARLGHDVVIGGAVYSAQSRFRVRTGALTLVQFHALLPDGAHFAAIRDAMRNLLGLTQSWELQLVLAASAVPLLALSVDQPRRLGLDSWLNTALRFSDADDLVVEGVHLRSEPAI